MTSTSGGSRTPQDRTPQDRTPRGSNPQGRAPQGRTRQGRTAQGRTGQGRPANARSGHAAPPSGEEEFSRAVAELEDGLAIQRQIRPELFLEPEPAPRRLAPFAHAVAATATTGSGDEDDAELGWGKLVLLFDVASQAGWDGKYRIIGYVRAELEPEMAADPLLSEVGWSWLTEALDTRTTGYRNISGTVTTVLTQGFGAKAGEPVSTGFELRASWSPVLTDEESAGLDGHVAAWCDTLCMAAGLPPVAPGVAALRSQRRRPRP